MSANSFNRQQRSEETLRYYRELVDHPDNQAFVQKIKEDPADAAMVLLVRAGWLERNGCPFLASQEREAARTHLEALALTNQLKAIAEQLIPVATPSRMYDRKQFADLARSLFRELGLEGINVSVAGHAQDSPIDVGVPISTEAGEAEVDWIYSSVEHILLTAFPATDMGDRQTGRPPNWKVRRKDD